ncbi:CSC1-like protein 1 [Varroa destructor]|uniref:CSC1-like protein 2 n=1 Tax=Varroa destructor TaxID=109461 RepID=A0A7M7M6A9_VARDE|nr:CSC1-like protein 1 [Varroa destructor]
MAATIGGFDRMEVQCALLARSRNLTLTLAPGYQGIPENLLMNVVAWMCLIVVYSVVNRTAKNYARMALVHRSERWSDVFYGQQYQQQQNGSVPNGNSANSSARHHTNSSRRTGAALTADSNTNNDDDGSLESLENANRATSFFSWIHAIWKIEDRHVLKKNGPDAVQYLTFQRHIIVFVFIVCICVITIILPLNALGVESKLNNKFAQTTIANISKDSKSLWVHIALSFVFLPLGVVFMRRFSTRLHIHAEEPRIGRTLMIAGVPRRHCKAELFRQHFAEAYPQCIIQDIQFAYDIRKLMDLVAQRETATQARLWCENRIAATHERPMMRPYTCGRCCCLGDYLGCEQVDALDYYRAEEQSLLKRVDEERRRALKNPVGFAFITFDSEEMAMLVCKDHKSQWQCYVPGQSQSTLSRELKPYLWKVMFAPPPNDLFWENLSVGKWAWYVRSVFINFLLFIVLFFLTTPFIILSSLSPILNIQMGIHPFFEKFLPTVMLWCVAALMPAMVTLSDLFIAHWTRSSRNHSVMKKIFIFLLFMVLILPSLGLSSAESFVGRLMQYRNATEVWKCLYLPDSGAFFVNYVITSSFVGTTMELIRFPQLCLYLIYTCLSRSKAEQYAVQRNSLFEFYFGVHYAWYLLMFAIIMVYSIPCPLVTPFGVLYLCFKHYVDKYNIYFVYNPSKTNKYIHATAIDFVIISLILLQFALFMYLYFKSDASMYTVVMCVIFMMSFCLFLGQAMIKCFRDFGPIKYVRQLQKTLERRRSRETGLRVRDNPYIPDALKSRPIPNLNMSQSAGNLPLYGSGAKSDSGIHLGKHGNNATDASAIAASGMPGGVLPAGPGSSGISGSTQELAIAPRSHSMNDLLSAGSERVEFSLACEDVGVTTEEECGSTEAEAEEEKLRRVVLTANGHVNNYQRF